MSCSECEEARKLAIEQNRLRQEHITQEQNKLVKAPTPKNALPQYGSFHRG